ncbi:MULTISPECIES: DEAD/DEAH box helicase [Flavobacteriaceae]|uniref:DEAD/DEAH box helicase n=2 Tax=Flavobacteriaceae TaxID=49546 RepID=A0A4Y8AX71_9FLAO|nr:MULTISPECIES: DEAD/DEAH box helicase [Flavobacteriaceae]TEW77091.1 DEAD/DEAH box helicase [Gramella jeungdoensis]GGK57971.1 helicase [Lutibacter litoralis]
MSENFKNQREILSKLGISRLNPMQEAAQTAISSNSETIILSPTGTGKTLAFLLPIIAELNPNIKNIQVLILVPSRELAIQIEQVIREIGSGYKATAVYGGRSGSKDRIALKHPPAILVGTPGRVADHIEREVFKITTIKTLVLDEFDKSLEVGFEEDMKFILEELKTVSKKILTSATQKVKIPSFVGIKNPKRLSFLDEKTSNLKLKTVVSKTQDKLASLERLLGHIGAGSGIIFCNLKDSIQNVSDFLNEKNINHGCFSGDLEQHDRERALIKFRNGTHKILVSTDLAARGIDIPEMDFIIHYELPTRPDEFIHRNGRTARMHSNGTAFILKYLNEELPVFIKNDEEISIISAQKVKNSNWSTLHISGGRKDKISKGDIAGLFFKQGNIKKEDLGIIELKQDCAYVAVSSTNLNNLVQTLNNSRLKKKKVRISILK